MYLFLCIVLGGSLLTGLIQFLTERKWVAGLLTGFLIFSFFGLVISGAAIDPDVKKVVISNTSLETIQDQNGIEDTHFFLGCGSINNRMYYTFYYGVEGGGYKLGKIDVDKATIFYTDENPRLETCKYERINTKHNKWTFKGAPYEYYYNIYVPKGTIKQNFVLDAI